MSLYHGTPGRLLKITFRIGTFSDMYSPITLYPTAPLATEMIKALGDEGIKKTTELFNLVYDTGYLPPDMSSSIFVRLPKKVNAT